MQPGVVPYTGYPVPLKTSPDPEPSASATPTVPEVTPDVASTALRRLISSELQNEGFDAAEPAAMAWLENEFVACMWLLPSKPS